ncbi:hypothetical protein BCY88_03375 [Paraburkholderia fungorum]|uniref:Uncharacterized protein n=1 Tax=Paraburkholderia fungorum TaxID=134537 RepID=A0A3R7HHU5_9BURK|nr:hypothetical protein BCY88_03375 [Paraburkholderia fungorum]
MDPFAEPPAPTPVDDVPLPLLPCEPEVDAVPKPPAAAAPIPPDAREPPSSCLQPSASNNGQVIGNACATISFAESAAGAV